MTIWWRNSSGTDKKVSILGRLSYKGYYIYKTITGKYKLRRAATRSPLKIVIGASGVFQKDWVSTDMQYLNILFSRHWSKYFSENTIDAILSEHVWEHLTMEEGQVAAQHCFKYLKPKGYIRVAVPDGFHPDPEYIEWVKVDGTGPSADGHKVLFNHETFCDLFARAGFQVRLLEYFDRDGKFHHNDWDVDRGMIHRSKRFDERNRGGELRYTSLIVDATKATNIAPRSYCERLRR